MHLAVKISSADKKLPGLCPWDGLADFYRVISFADCNLSSSPFSPCFPTKQHLLAVTRICLNPKVMHT